MEFIKHTPCRWN